MILSGLARSLNGISNQLSLDSSLPNSAKKSKAAK